MIGKYPNMKQLRCENCKAPLSRIYNGYKCEYCDAEYKETKEGARFTPVPYQVPVIQPNYHYDACPQPMYPNSTGDPMALIIWSGTTSNTIIGESTNGMLEIGCAFNSNCTMHPTERA